MDLLAYWRWDIYRRDLDEGAGFNFNSRQSRLHSAIEPGERLWLVTGKPTEQGTQYIVVACLQVAAKTENPPDYRYGRYRVWADIKNSFYYSAADAPDTAPLLHRLQFVTNQPIQTENIGQALQTMRSLTPNDSTLMRQWAQNLPLEPRAHQIADEYTLEKAFDTDESKVREIITAYHTGVSQTRRDALLRAFPRNRQYVNELHNLYEGRCQLCGFDPLLVYGVRACNAHHIVYLSRGGRDILENMMLLCPNHHDVIHAATAVFDFGQLHYVFSNGRREPVVLNRHLPPQNAFTG